MNTDRQQQLDRILALQEEYRVEQERVKKPTVNGLMKEFSNKEFVFDARKEIRDFLYNLDEGGSTKTKPRKVVLLELDGIEYSFYLSPKSDVLWDFYAQAQKLLEKNKTRCKCVVARSGSGPSTRYVVIFKDSE